MREPTEKPPKNLNAPALVWHVACWTKADQAKQIPNWIKDTVDTFILTLCRTIESKVGAVELSPCISHVRMLFNSVSNDTSFVRADIPLSPRQKDVFASTSRAVSLKFKWHELDIAIRFEIHTEYFSISTFAELDKKRIGPPYSTLASLNNNIDVMLEYLETSNRKLAQPLNKYFFREFWNSYEIEILSDATLKPLMQGAPFNQVFADFRGLILSEQAVKFPGTELHAADRPLGWGGAAKSKFLPLIQDQRRYECAVNYVLDGRAFYMSTLGPQLPSTPVTERIPLEFIVFANQRSTAYANLRPTASITIVNKWQLGRLVGQLLLLGTLRLCALKDVKLLHEAGRKLAALDETTQLARDAIASVGNPPDGPKQKVALDLIGRAHQHLNGITGVFFGETRSGLLYRIERSRYYVKQFNDTVVLLRIKRLEGDQPYNQFIERRLGPEFDFIDRLGVRYERATRNVVTLDQNYLAMTQNELVMEATNIDKETRGIQTDIQSIQAGGEAILLAFLVPYYVSHLLVLIIGEDVSYVPIMTVNVWLIGFALAVGRFWKLLTFSTTVQFFLLLFLFLSMLFPFENEILEGLATSARHEKAAIRETDPDVRELRKQPFELQKIQRQIEDNQGKQDGLAPPKDAIQSQPSDQPQPSNENRNTPGSQPPEPEPKR